MVEVIPLCKRGRGINGVFANALDKRNRCPECYPISAGAFGGSLSGLTPEDLATRRGRSLRPRSTRPLKQASYAVVGNVIPRGFSFPYVPRRITIGGGQGITTVWERVSWLPFWFQRNRKTPSLLSLRGGGAGQQHCCFLEARLRAASAVRCRVDIV